MPTSLIAVGVSTLVAGAVETWVGSVILAKLAGAVAGVAFTALVKGGGDDGFGANVASAVAPFDAGGRSVTVRQSIAPWAVVYGRARIGGVWTYMEATGSNEYLHAVSTLTGHVSSSIDAVYFGDELVEFDGGGNAIGKYAGYVTAVKSLGDEAGQPFPGLVAESAGKWTDTHRQSGRTKIYLRFRRNPDLFPTGLPNLWCVVSGKRVYDPRSVVTAWSDNPALCLADYLCADPVGVRSVYADEIDEALLIAAANVCDESVTLAAGGTEKRYTCNGVAYGNEAPKDAIPKLLGAMQGRAVLVGGRWRIRAGAYMTPAVSIDEDDFRGPMRITTRASRRDSFNAVRGVFSSPDNLWQPSDFPPVVSSAYQVEDSGETIWEDIRLPFTNSATMAQRIAKIELQRARLARTIAAPLKFSAYAIEPPETVSVTLARPGYVARAFEVLESSLAVDQDERGAPILGVDVSLRETAAAVYDWSTADEGVFVESPAVALPSPFQISAPGVPLVMEQLYNTTGSAGVKTRAVVSWSTPADAFVESYDVEYKASGDAAWIVLPSTRGNTADIDDITPGMYDFRVRAYNTFRVASVYSGQASKEIVGLVAQPADVSGLYVTNASGVALARWDLHPDLDVRQGGQITIRHSPLTTGATWNDGIVLHDFAGNAVSGIVPARTGTYMAKAADSSSHWSEGTVSWVLTEAALTGLSTIGSLTLDPTFSGTKTACGVLSSKLQLTGSLLWDALPGTVDDLVDVDSAGGQSIEGTYETTYIDCTTVASRRWEASIKAAAVDNADAWDARVTDIDGWDSIDGTASITDCNVEIYIATTSDNPAGAPAWSSWTRFHVGEFNCRAAKFEAILSAGSAQHNIQISELRFAAKG